MNKRPFIALAAVSLVLLVLPVQATTIHVPDEQPTIQAGIDAASHGDTVLVACGTYYEHDINMKSGVYLTSETGLAECVTIDAQQQDRVFYCANVDSVTSIVGFTITGGLEYDGGGVYCCNSSSPTLTDCEFAGNQASYGGGMHCCDSSSPTLTNCTFSGNQASYGAGGGMCCNLSSPSLTDCTFVDNTVTTGDGGGMHCYFSSPTLTNCTFSGNRIDIYGKGGGMYCYASSSPTLTDCEFAGNQANYGGGMYCVHSSSPTLTDCTFVDNTADGDGGGIQCHLSSPSLTVCTLVGNTASGYGGGMYCYNSSSPVLTECKFEGNQADGGGGMSCQDSSSPTLTGCAFVANQANYGGGMHCYFSSPIVLRGCTFAANQANYGDGYGGGMCCLSHVTVTASIIAFSQLGEAIYCGTGMAELICCDVYGNAGGDWVGCIADQYGVSGNFSEDPLFCLEENPNQPYSLHEGSPCLPENSPCGELVGAFGMGCGPVSPVEYTSWGSIKGMFR